MIKKENNLSVNMDVAKLLFSTLTGKQAWVTRVGGFAEENQ